VAHLRDISQQQAVLNRMQRLETLSHLQREVATTELDLDARRQTVAEVAMDVTGADSAVVEEADGDEMVYCAVAGDAHEQKGLRLPIADSISGLAYRERASQLVRDTDEDSRVPLKEQARAVGFRSGILAPLIYRDRTYGVLKVVAREPDRFDEEQRLLLELASGVLAASLYNAFEYHHELERRGMLLDALPAYISYIDADHRYQEVNTVYEQRFGLTADEIRGKRVSDLLGAEGYRRLRPYLEAAVRGERVSYEMEIPFADGDSRTLFGDYVPDSDVSGEVRGLYAIVRDVTDVRLAHSDYLTGLVNRREFEEQARRLVAVAERYESDLSLIMVDIDRFKEINDRHGHLAGDAVLKGLAELFRDVLRRSDIAGRWGGDEFGVLLPQTDIARAQDLAGRLCRAVRDRQNHQPEGEERFPEVGELTVSAGVAALASGEALEDLLRRADYALYQAKREGRNRVQSAS
jgi:diguanylate cyclase (GGDEF)-like protein/PAS domain S-box-containing protein